MEIKCVPFEGKMTLIINHQKVTITPFLTGEEGNIKIGIAAPACLEVNREEVYKKKQEKLKKAKET